LAKVVIFPVVAGITTLFIVLLALKRADGFVSNGIDDGNDTDCIPLSPGNIDDILFIDAAFGNVNPLMFSVFKNIVLVFVRLGGKVVILCSCKLKQPLNKLCRFVMLVPDNGGKETFIKLAQP